MQASTLAFTTPADAPRWKRWLVYSPLARILIYVALLMATVKLTMLGFHAIGINRNSPVLLRAYAECFGRAIPPLLAYLVLVKGIERRPLAEFARDRWLRHSATGLFAGALLFSAVVGELWLLGSYHVLGFNLHAHWWIALITVGVGAGIGEEIMFRGALYRIVEEGLGTWGALVISALAFGFIHIQNPGATVWSSSAIAIEAGLLFGLLYHVTRSLPICMGLHASWNFMQGTVYGIPVSGTAADGFLVSTRTGPTWLSGGAFGAEASVIALLMCSVCTLALLWLAVRRGSIVPPAWKRTRAVELSAWDRMDKVR
ncbi:MAG TPA: CPBP family intramembrane glutamic endopeptidase [Xanthomonadaceae bacterium]